MLTMGWFAGSVMSNSNSVLELKKIGIISVPEEICWSRYFGHHKRIDKNIWPRKVIGYEIPGSLPRGRPQLHWREVIARDPNDFNIKKGQLC